MNASRHPCPLTHPSQAEIDAFRREAVEPLSLASPAPLQVGHGHVGADGLFDADVSSERWFAIEEYVADDIVFWHPRSDRLATWSGRAFALGEQIITEAATYSFDCALNIFNNPLDWLRARRDGIVVLDWTQAFDRLRDCPRIAIVENLLPAYQHHMKPGHMPDLFVMPNRRRNAA